MHIILPHRAVGSWLTFASVVLSSVFTAAFVVGTCIVLFSMSVAAYLAETSGSKAGGSSGPPGSGKRPQVLEIQRP